jgi:hypothetical protein
MNWSLYDAMEKGLVDILTFRLARRPALTERSVLALAIGRFDGR